MRAPQIVRDFLAWRWAPCVALTVGSLTYVALAVLLIPSQIDGGSRPSDLATAFDRSAARPSTAFGASLTPNSVAAPPTAHEPARHALQNSANDPMGAPRRGFSPPIEQPEAPPQPPAPPPQTAMPPPLPAMPVPLPAGQTPQPVLNQPPPTPPQDQPPTPPPAPPPPANGDEAAPPPPATQ